MEEPRSLLQKSRLEQIFGTIDQNIGVKPFKKYSSFSTLVISHFYRLKRLLMNGPHQQMTKPKFLIQKSTLETYLLRIFDQNHGLTPLEIRNFFNYNL